jgi:16S rRNA (guanine(966)-N(2))-methyltransferase RsmD
LPQRRFRPRDSRTGGRAVELRIVGGRLRGRRLKYSGEAHLRPMKERVREALFNLIGPAIRGLHAVDLFAGTGALALEAISRGAVGATLIERHFPTAAIIRENAQALDVASVVSLVTADTFSWARQVPALPDLPWAVFCAPPYGLFEERPADLRWLLEELLGRAAEGSVVAVEAAAGFNVEGLPEAEQWDVRRYPPAALALRRLGSPT